MNIEGQPQGGQDKDPLVVGKANSFHHFVKVVHLSSHKIWEGLHQPIITQSCLYFTQKFLQCPRPQAQNYGENQCEQNMFVLCGCVHLLFKLHIHIYGYFAYLFFTIYFLYKVLNRPCDLHMLNSVWVESIYKIFFLGMVL